MYHNNISLSICFPPFQLPKTYNNERHDACKNERERVQIATDVGLENEDMTPTLKQIWVAVRQLQQDMNQIKIQVNEERALRSYLQQLLMGHLEGLSSTKNC